MAAPAPAADTATPLSPEGLRALAPAAANHVYLDVASTGIAPAAAVAAVQRFMADCTGHGKTDALWAEALESARSRYARLVNAAPEDIAFTKNCTEGINLLAQAIEWREGDNAVYCPMVEHEAVIYPVLNLVRRGVELRAAPARHEALDVEALLAAADARTRLIAVSSVTFVPGYRTDLVRLGEACRKRGILLVVDGTQSIGVLRHDMAALPVDGFAVSAHKGLLGPYGLGLLWVRREVAQALAPMHLGKPGVAFPPAHPCDPGGTLAAPLKPDARRFEGGQAPLNAAWLAASLELLLGLGAAATEAHACALAERLRAGLDRHGFPANRDPFGLPASHLVTLGRLGTGGLLGTADTALAALAERLRAANVRFSLRRGQIRFSCHAYNTEADIEAVLEVARTQNTRAAE